MYRGNFSQLARSALIISLGGNESRRSVCVYDHVNIINISRQLVFVFDSESRWRKKKVQPHERESCDRAAGRISRSTRSWGEQATSFSRRVASYTQFPEAERFINRSSDKLENGLDRQHSCRHRENQARSWGNPRNVQAGARGGRLANYG